MKTLYSFITSLCKDQDMKLEDLQKKLKTSRTTLYRYMKGINQITPEVAENFIKALNMSMQQSLEFTKIISLSAIDRSLIESREVLDDFLFGKKAGPTHIFDIEMILYDNDKYLRTFKEILDKIYSFKDKKNLTGTIKIYSCISENVFAHVSEFLERIFSEGINIEAEQFVGLSEKNYLQNACSFINAFPLMKYEKYRFYYRTIEVEDMLLPDSILVSLKYTENDKQKNQFYIISLYEDSLADCIAFTDIYMYGYLSRIYENFKSSYVNTMRKYGNMDFEDDIFIEMSKHGRSCLVKPNPCYDKIPIEVYQNILDRMSSEDLIKLVSSVTGQKIDSGTLPATLKKIFTYLEKRVEAAAIEKHTDIYSKQGMIEFAETGKLTDHLTHLPAFNKEEIKIILKHIYDRRSETKGEYSLFITETEYANNDFIFSVYKDYGIVVEYIFPEHTEGLWKMILIQNTRLASIFFDYFDNHIPINKAINKIQTDDFLKSLIG